jgi:hypothetical protein
MQATRGTKKKAKFRFWFVWGAEWDDIDIFTKDEISEMVSYHEFQTKAEMDAFFLGVETGRGTEWKSFATEEEARECVRSRWRPNGKVRGLEKRKKAS